MLTSVAPDEACGLASVASSPLEAVERPSDSTRIGPMSVASASESTLLPNRSRLSPSAMNANERRVQTAVVGVPESLQTMHANLRVTALKQEISSLEEKVRLFSEELEETHRAGKGVGLYIRNVGGSPRVVLKFDDNSYAAQVDDDLLDALGNAARSANRIYLHGHTDAYVASDTGTELAILRALEVRRLLISLNVDPERIRLFYRGVGNFVANNSTPEGKALNRRVEIELRKW